MTEFLTGKGRSDIAVRQAIGIRIFWRYRKIDHRYHVITQYPISIESFAFYLLTNGR